MPESKTDMDWIDGYLRKELTEKELVTFQERIEQDTSFAALLETQQVVADGIRLSMLSNKVRHFQQLGQTMDHDFVEDATIGAALRYDKNLSVLERLKERGEEMDKAETKHSRKHFTNYIFNKYAAVAATLLFMLTLWWVNGEYASQAIASNFIELPLSNQSMSNATQSDIILGKIAFFNEDYEKAQTILQEVPPNSKDYMETKVLLAYILFKRKEHEASINQFNQLLDTDFESLPNIYKDRNKLRWNRLMVYIGKNKADNIFINKELQFFKNSKSDFYKKKATKLQEILNSNWRIITIN